MKLKNRELSWLSFNERVLQEALDESVPLIERMRFLGIYSNNMDEFFRVRVAYIRRIIVLNKKRVPGFEGTPAELLEEIRRVIMKQQKKFRIAYNRILKELEEEGIYHITGEHIHAEQREELRKFFHTKLKHEIVPIILGKETLFPRLKDSGVYLAVKMIADGKKKQQLALIEIPNEFPRFYQMKDDNGHYIILLDDIIRIHLHDIFSIFTFDEAQAYTFKFTRDAELDLDDDISVSFMEKIRKSIKKRSSGEPVRFVYDEEMPQDLLDYLLRELHLEMGVNTIPGGRYHNFKDFMNFPDFGRSDFVYPKRRSRRHPVLEGKASLIKQILKKDVILHYPYQRFGYVVDVLREAAIDPKVRSIKINVYRVARNSQIMNALINAVANGKEVFVVIELQARFDEENNLYWVNRLREAGAKVSLGIEELKVHSKLIQISRKGKKDSLITYIGTGNFHEKTANVYEDIGIITAHPEIGEEVKRIFNIMDGFSNNFRFDHLYVSPYNTRDVIGTMIDTEIENAKAGKEAFIQLKINSLVDSEMIGKLYAASQAGVTIQLIVRGICCLVPGVEGLSENISARSIVGRYLEHSRYMIFANGGDPRYFIASADWMERNLDKRIEVGCPIYAQHIKDRIRRIFEIQWSGNLKSRLIDEDQTNLYYRDDQPNFSSQDELYNFYAELSKAEPAFDEI